MNPSKLSAGATWAAASVDRVARLREDWRMARAAQMDLQRMATPRANVLVVGSDGAVQNLLDLLQPGLQRTVKVWCPDEPLVLPMPGRSGTLILHEVGTLAREDQIRLREWLVRTRNRTQVISTTSASLLPQVQDGTFDDTLYYRLNTIYVDMT